VIPDPDKADLCNPLISESHRRASRPRDEKGIIDRYTIYDFDTHLIVHVIPVAHVVACAGASLNVPPHVELDLFAAHASARSHHRVPHTITAGTIHSRITLIQVTPTGIIVTESAGAPGIRGVSHPGLRTFLVTQSRLWPMECRGYVLKESHLRIFRWYRLDAISITLLQSLTIGRTNLYFLYARHIPRSKFRGNKFRCIELFHHPRTKADVCSRALFRRQTMRMEHDLICIGRDMLLFIQ